MWRRCWSSLVVHSRAAAWRVHQCSVTAQVTPKWTPKYPVDTEVKVIASGEVGKVKDVPATEDDKYKVPVASDADAEFKEKELEVFISHRGSHSRERIRRCCCVFQRTRTHHI